MNPIHSFTNPAKKQKETTYILYMMIASMYKKCNCRSVFLETALSLYYREMSASKQIRRESAIEKELSYWFPQERAQLQNLQSDCTITFKNNSYYLTFFSFPEEMHAIVFPDGSYSIWSEGWQEFLPAAA